MPFMHEIKTMERFAGGAGQIMVEKFDYNGTGQIVYRGVNSEAQPSEGENTWFISKLSYSGTQLIRVEYRELEPWTDRALLDWLA